MLLKDPFLTLKIVLAILLTLYTCVAYAYLANARRKTNDSDKKVYSAFAIMIAPITLPLFLSLGILVFFLRAMLFITFLVIFTVLTIALRKPFLFIWLDEIARKIGDPLLKINTMLIQIAFRPWAQHPQPA